MRPVDPKKSGSGLTSITSGLAGVFAAGSDSPLATRLLPSASTSKNSLGMMLKAFRFLCEDVDDADPRLARAAGCTEREDCRLCLRCSDPCLSGLIELDRESGGERSECALVGGVPGGETLPAMPPSSASKRLRRRCVSKSDASSCCSARGVAKASAYGESGDLAKFFE